MHTQGSFCLKQPHFIHDAAYDPELPNVRRCVCVCEYVCVRFGRCDSVTFRWAQPGVKRHSVRPPCYWVHLSFVSVCVCVCCVCECVWVCAGSVYLLWVYVLSACTWPSTNKLLQTTQYRPQSPGVLTEKVRYWHTWTHTNTCTNI